ncbi:hypothetical protein E3N88_40181 [Mikania micrantha]|uniref:Uncharacterized protein n=1 Tax=Mikania micrantha TaxID=192012 RepID=A0A5N6LM06_9ASTR|nr:hypothetical protein E3N88_40181 [Mikania micrantha]
MPPATMTVTTDTRKLPRPGRGGVISQGLTEEESRVRAIAKIVNNMVELSRNGENVDLNALKSAACRNSDSELRRLLVATANRSILVVEDIDCSAELHDREQVEAAKAAARKNQWRGYEEKSKIPRRVHTQPQQAIHEQQKNHDRPSVTTTKITLGCHKTKPKMQIGPQGAGAGVGPQPRKGCWRYFYGGPGSSQGESPARSGSWIGLPERWLPDRASGGFQKRVSRDAN